MKIPVLSLITMLTFSQFLFAENGIVSIESKYSVQGTADRFESILKAKGFTVFNRIDHQKNAAGVSLKIRPTTVIIFGNPKVGTKLMQCAQSIAIDLPQKVLIWEGADSNVWLSYNDPQYINKRHGIQGCDGVSNKISNALSKLGNAATSK